jgi:hypothetical protein
MDTHPIAKISIIWFGNHTRSSSITFQEAGAAESFLLVTFLLRSKEK